ncbi:MAG TPA: dihydroneopterin aldolase [Candidatus Gallacutalibacter pullistercoris]|nr:dihydroneopterin aldolase [Candidatus Gallacutalibacter pullistercoris]
MDKIHIVGLEVFAYHGVNPEEKRDGQHFVLDVVLECDLKKPGRTDDLNDTVNYAAIRKVISRVMTEQSYDLIERAAARVAEEILKADEKVERVHVLLKKPEAPINAKFDYVAVEILRERKDFI